MNLTFRFSVDYPLSEIILYVISFLILTTVNVQEDMSPREILQMDTNFPMHAT